ncbi:MAG: hypothetical protein KatS3mg062_0192 [Tepidiforma sp.]|nr:MAG: hypothetical protein KatS3mg062_0192 [Tepidiforma sp.]
MALPVLREIWQFPVKGMAGVQLPRAALQLNGIPGDRTYAFVRVDRTRLFPWLTLREFPELAAWEPSWREQPDGGHRLAVRAPDGAAFDIDDPTLTARISGAAGLDIRLHADYRGNFDVAPVSIIAAATIERLCAEAGVAPESRRFRMNLVVEGVPPFGENAWVGRVLRVGTARLAVVERDQRCAVITVDPDGSGLRTPGVLKVAGSLNDACAGVYAAVVTPGEVHAGDAIEVEPASIGPGT